MEGTDEGRADSDRSASDDFADLRLRLCRAVERRCPRWLRDQREDIVQVAVMRLMQVSGRGERSAPFPSSYLWKVAFSAMIDEIRRLRRGQTVSLDDEVADPPVAGSRSNPEAVRRGREIGGGIRSCLGRLAADRRRAVTLHLVGHSVPEITRLMRWNLKRADNLVYRGLDELRACLRAKGFDPVER